jgi:hypothetical protein
MDKQSSALVKGLLSVVKEYIEYRFKKEIVSLEPEDGSGRKFIVVTKDQPLKKQFIRL